MALQAPNELFSSTIQSHQLGLLVFWHDANGNPTMELKKWLDLFQVAMMVKYLSEPEKPVRSILKDVHRWWI